MDNIETPVARRNGKKYYLYIVLYNVSAMMIFTTGKLIIIKKWVLVNDNIETPVPRRNDNKNAFIMVYIVSVIMIFTTENKWILKIEKGRMCESMCCHVF